MLSCKRTSFSDISGDRRFRFSDNTLPEVLNTSLLIHSMIVLIKTVSEQNNNLIIIIIIYYPVSGPVSGEFYVNYPVTGKLLSGYNTSFFTHGPVFVKEKYFRAWPNLFQKGGYMGGKEGNEPV